ncbi:hypothetical protein RhiirA5_350861 [Rhizophagus irregularis]|uniref:RBR-type E3 ubiquitin transferase n=3 Tax=Rhizophagus irregularis TaxID=588596 RepID=U9UA82_RHIID|nr:hypothetical protein GLOIN_2v1661741 [Rhizophagus irregularis DAOM 181602=DAOM 197198]EXX79404.1 Hel1p [Rhizophagus irregularis DAOM 197198w]PKC14070.1 hypothetical protein RhiirA5_350861 [Rhizophagus irregularis]PKK79587.1 hypothetical protein RhiirC2_726791 [Rhizophagus irregularis]PKY15329.1 hypothetical protein RhiirB3_401448 [Rhizophagus irregularis]POG65968.1 hypothetical protein GLOIN_2v1661741 [Rhizophagus irregularis DAOM 181602=DAOM 197198]|eukprot:XP_025172834.1 hypothetical protein GLOIN_2v1661741 [Rhizophagus irregularis DAOM 181602=DAOM 197198]
MSNMSECTICYERDNDFRNITSNCSHQAVVCVKCVNEYIKNRSNEKQIFNIPCPTNGCNKLMERHDIKNFATKEVFEKYDELIFKIAIQRFPEFRWCKAPCGAGQIHIGKDKTPVVICESCGVESCYNHDVVWHADQTCKEYDMKNKKSDFVTKNYISRETRGCPGCSIPIVKNGGCDHITCTKCGHQFCWLCLQTHPLHKPTCGKLRKWGRWVAKFSFLSCSRTTYLDS